MKWLVTVIFFLTIAVVFEGCHAAKSSKDSRSFKRERKGSPKLSKKKNRTILKSAKPDFDSDGVPDYQEVEAMDPVMPDPIMSDSAQAYPIIIVEDSYTMTSRPLQSRNAQIDDKTNATDTIPPKPTQGTIAYSVPDTMTVGIKYSVKIRISKDGNKQTLIAGDHEIPINDVNVHSTITIEEVRVAPVMSASLTSPDNSFAITSLSTETQNIEDEGYTEWEWSIIPNKSGNNQLKLIVKVRIVNDQGGFFKDIVVFERTIKTKANIKYEAKGFFAKYWQWLTTTFIIPIFIWWWKRKKKKEEPEKKEE